MASNPRVYESIVETTGRLAAGMSDIFRYNSPYGPATTNDSMPGTSVPNVSVGGYLSAKRNVASKRGIPAPTNEWLRNLME